MTRKLEGLIERLQRATTLEELQSLIQSLRDVYEVDHLVYHSVKSSGEQYGILTYDREWVERYMDRNYARIDPVVMGCFNRFHSTNWKELDWSGKAARRFLGEAREHGVGNQGLSVPVRGPNGQFALFTVNHKCSDAAWAGFAAEFQRDLILIAYYLNQKALELDQGTIMPQAAQLSPRENDVLTLLAKGYSRSHAAETLKISEHTLRVYIEAARFKLGSSNTTHAVATALSRGLIIV